MTHTEYMRVWRRRRTEMFGDKSVRDRWSPEADAKALEMRSRGMSYGQIALKVLRTPNAVAARLHYLNKSGGVSQP